MVMGNLLPNFIFAICTTIADGEILSEIGLELDAQCNFNFYLIISR